MNRLAYATTRWLIAAFADASLRVVVGAFPIGAARPPSGFSRASAMESANADSTTKTRRVCDMRDRPSARFRQRKAARGRWEVALDQRRRGASLPLPGDLTHTFKIITC